MEPDNKISTEVSTKNTDPVSFFDNNNQFVLAYKKTEKLASAVYMVTGLFLDSEPMKWALRKKVGELLSFTLTYKDTPEGGLGDFVYNIKTQVTELVSLIDVSFHGGLVSQMNFSIIRQEFLNLVNILSTQESSTNISQNSSLSKTFFDVSQSHSSFAKNDLDRIYKTSESATEIQRMSFTDLKDRGLNINKNNLKKSARQSVILGLLKKKKELSIKDIAAVIKDCSEKTIQRELNYFISTGLLKRRGVRRWSKYSLA